MTCEDVNVDAVAASVSEVFWNWQCVFRVRNVWPDVNNSIEHSQCSALLIIFVEVCITFNS